MAALKVGVAMSGGVDSTMAATLLREQGHDLAGFFMLLPLPGLEAQVLRVREVADRLSIPLTQVDLRDRFTERILGYFIESYQAGLTPNPCIVCNHAIKFGLLVEAMRAAGMERIATGHYARIVGDDAQTFVARGADPGKDQSYFLARLTADQRARILFPLGEWTKARVYERAATLGFHFDGQESQDVCFLNEGLADFLTRQGLADRIGEVVTRDGRRIGEHRGAWRYTIGQRRGLGLPDATPWYVVGLDGAANRVIVGKQDDLFASRCTVHSLTWANEPPPLPWRGPVQLRSRHAAAPAGLTCIGPDTWQLEFATPQRAITPGQFAVLYEGDRVLGSGIIGTASEEGP